ncbi:putative quinol monooxygenase [Dyadobacter sp. CY312]|uniref:putative quinol monooxygenase n=1 Tax=Dyadobacter sp. CY312 TaxID=2907303 RepID=UPI001F3684C7|nr:putative quinol monooxygenase [Dyadobacter sp. CY312]MCE7038784.1 antibiotic biosynthesis monooxygenase [Dyadobacter sp. CY312]
MSVYLTAIIEAKPGHESQVRTLLETLTAKSRNEEACIQYDLHESVEKPGYFIFHEEWTDQAGLDIHNSQPHIDEFKAAASGILAAEVIIHKTEKLV